MTTEEIIREVVSKICPFHGKRAIVKVYDTGHVNVSACCDEFHKQMENIITNGLATREHSAKNTLVHS